VQVSVVIPTYNRAEMVVRAVDSVLAQSESADQIIVVDDGSSDATQQLLASYHEQIEVIYQPNRGVSAARNSGIKAARYEWIAFLDSDDCWHKEKLYYQKAFHRKYPEILWSHTLEAWIRNGKTISQKKHHAKPEGACFYESLSFCKIAPSTVMLHRDILEEIGYFDVDLPVCEDYDLWLRILKVYDIGLVHEVLTTKYAGHTQLSFSDYILDQYRIKALCKHLPEKKVHEEIEKKLMILKTGAQKHKNQSVLHFCDEIEMCIRRKEAL
jgi:glycosyltransferase involved in cell wall biosynthesis